MSQMKRVSKKPSIEKNPHAEVLKACKLNMTSLDHKIKPLIPVKEVETQNKIEKTIDKSMTVTLSLDNYLMKYDHLIGMGFLVLGFIMGVMLMSFVKLT